MAIGQNNTGAPNMAAPLPMQPMQQPQQSMQQHAQGKAVNAPAIVGDAEPKMDLIKDFFTLEKKIFDFVNSAKEGYFHSDCFRRLERRIDRMHDSYNLRIGSGNWKSKIVLPVVKEQMRLIRAMTLMNFRQDPIISLTPILDTPFENAQNLQAVLNMNYAATQWRSRAWRPMVNQASIVGCGVLYSYYYESNGYRKRTVTDNRGINQRVAIRKQIQQVRHDNIPLKNYFQNPTAVDANRSEFQGHIDTVLLTELVDCAKNQPDVYIQSNLQKIIKEASGGRFYKDTRYSVDNKIDRDTQRTAMDRTRYWGTINIKGNEEDTTIYYVEWIGDKIIRFQADVYDDEIKPYSVFSFEQRYDYWWGNFQVEDVIPHENYLNLQLNIAADKALQSQVRYKFYKKGQIDPSDINNRAINDGWVPLDVGFNDDIRTMVHELNTQPVGMGEQDWITREVKESMGRNSSTPNLQSPVGQGGPANTTATAASIMQSGANMLTSDFMEQFGYGLENMGKIDSIMLLQFLDGNIMLRPDIKQQSKLLRKPDILGDYDYSVKNSTVSNSILDAQKLLGQVQQLMQIKGSQLPEAQALNMAGIIRALVDSMGLPVDTDSVYPEQSAMQQTVGYQQSAQPQEAQQAQALVNGDLQPNQPQPNQSNRPVQVQSAGIPQGVSNV